MLFRSTPPELKKMIQSIRDVEKALGDGKKRVLDVENELRNFAVRRIQAIKNIKKGDKLVEGYNIDVLRPGKRTRGAEARFLPKIIGKISNRAIKSGDGIRLQDCN